MFCACLHACLPELQLPNPLAGPMLPPALSAATKRRITLTPSHSTSVVLHFNNSLGHQSMTARVEQHATAALPSHLHASPAMVDVWQPANYTLLAQEQPSYVDGGAGAGMAGSSGASPTNLAMQVHMDAASSIAAPGVSAHAQRPASVLGAFAGAVRTPLRLFGGGKRTVAPFVPVATTVEAAADELVFWDE